MGKELVFKNKSLIIFLYCKMQQHLKLSFFFFLCEEHHFFLSENISVHFS